MIKVTDIRPGYDQDEGRDILKFNVNGMRRTEYLSGSFLGLEKHGSHEEGYGLYTQYRLDDDYNEADRNEIRAILANWIASHGHETFTVPTNNEDIFSIEHGLNVSQGVVVWLMPEAAERLMLEGEAYEITPNGSVSWTDRDLGDQYYENGAGGDSEDFTLRFNLANPETAIGDIKWRLSQIAHLREEPLVV